MFLPGHQRNQRGNLEALPANKEIFITGLDDCHAFEWKGKTTDSTVWNTEEPGDINHATYILKNGLLLCGFFSVMNLLLSNFSA